MMIVWFFFVLDTIVSVSNLVNVYEKAAESLEGSLYQPLLELYESGLVPLQVITRLEMNTIL